MLRVKWNSGWHRCCSEVFVHGTSLPAGAGAWGLVHVFVWGGRWAPEPRGVVLALLLLQVSSRTTSKSLQPLPFRMRPWEKSCSTFWKDFCSFEDEKEHPRESRAGDATAHIKCCRTTELVPLAALAAGWGIKYSILCSLGQSRTD